MELKVRYKHQNSTIKAHWVPIFFLEKGLQFYLFPHPSPQIVNGRPHEQNV